MRHLSLIRLAAVIVLLIGVAVAASILLAGPLRGFFAFDPWVPAVVAGLAGSAVIIAAWSSRSPARPPGFTKGLTSSASRSSPTTQSMRSTAAEDSSSLSTASGERRTFYSLKDVVKNDPELQDFDFYIIPYDASLYARTSLEAVSRGMAGDLQVRFEQRPYEEIVLCGYGGGGLVARRAYLNNMGGVPAGSAGNWADRVQRIVLFGTPNRGINVDALKDLSYSVPCSPGSA